MKFRYPLATTSWDKAEYDAMKHIISLDRFTMGESVANFESNFAEYIGSRFAVMVNSGSSANLLMTGALFYTKNSDLKLHRGDEIIVPAVAWSTTYYPLCQYGLHLKFVDIDIETLNYDLAELKSAITNRTRAIMAVNLLGNPNDFSAIDDIIGKQNIILIEDNCESMGAKLNRRHTGTFGLMGSFSTFFSHHISTIEGGILTTDDDELNALARSIRAHGWTRDMPKEKNLFEPPEDDFYEAYQFILPGYNVRPQEINAAIGIEQLKKLPSMTKIRRQNLSTFQNLFGSDERFILQRENGKSSCFCFTVILNPEKRFDRIQAMAALKDADIGFRMITGGCFPRHDAIKHFDYELVGEMTNGNIAHDNGIFVGNHPIDLSPQIKRFYQVMDGLSN